MAKLNIRNRNRDKFDKDGKPKAPNWEYRFEAAKIDGKRKAISKSGFKTKREAEIAGAKALTEYDNAGLKFEPSDISVADFLEYWLNNYCKTNIGDSTLVSYTNIVRKHFIPAIGYYKLKSVSTLVLQELIDDIYVKQNFTKGYMRNILKVMKGAFKYAKVTAKLIPSNPADEVSLPNMDTNLEAEEIIILSKDNVNTILNRFKDSPATYYAMLTAYYTGCRVGEVYGLTWDCIDFENKKIIINKVIKTIERTTTKDKKRVRAARGKTSTRWCFGSCKTPSSHRTIDVGDTLLNALKEYKLWQEMNELEYGEFYIKHFLKDETTPTNRKVQRLIPMSDSACEIPLTRTFPVFIKENGEYHGTETPKYASKVINYELGIQYNFHAFRHTHATMLIEAGVPVKTVSNRLGHSSVRTTLETYVHVTEKMKNDAVAKFETNGCLDSNANIINIAEAKRKNIAKIN